MATWRHFREGDLTAKAQPGLVIRVRPVHRYRDHRRPIRRTRKVQLRGAIRGASWPL